MGPVINRMTAEATKRATPLVTQRYRLQLARMSELFFTLARCGGAGGAVLGGAITTGSQWHQTLGENRKKYNKGLAIHDLADFIMFAPPAFLVGSICGAAIGAVGTPVAVAISPIAIPYLAYKNYSRNKTGITNSD